MGTLTYLLMAKQLWSQDLGDVPAVCTICRPIWALCLCWVLWLVGLVSSYTMGGLIHVLLVIAIVVILVRLIQGRRL